jgi:anti-anti-sigma regulatory factor
MPESPAPSVEHLPPAVVVRVLASELRKPEVDAICAEVDAARVSAPVAPFVIDMARVTFAGSMALGVLVGLSKEFRTRQQPLVLTNLGGTPASRSRSAGSTACWRSCRT